MKKTLAIAFGFMILMFTVIALAAPVPDTGVTKCYDAYSESTCPTPGHPFYGQDASYTINPMSYTKLDANGNALPDSATAWSTVRDNVTGLIWEMKNNKDYVEDYNNPHDADNMYTHDSTKSLDIADFIRALNDARYGGFSDWRMPTIKELTYIVNHSIYSSAKLKNPMINTDYFPNTYAASFWSSTTNAYDTNEAWYMSFSGFDQLTIDKNFFLHVRAVRGGQSGLFGDLAIESFDTWGSETIGDADAAGSYTDNGNGTVTDTSTGLMWRQAGSSNEMTWEQALTYCENMDFGGYTDWRLPTINELRSLVDYSRHHPAINTTYFPIPNAVSLSYWSSTTFAHPTGSAYGVSFYHGYGGGGDKDGSRLYVRAVRGGQSGSLGNLVISPLSRSVTKDAGTTTFSVSNSGTGTMSWSAAVTSSGDWLRITSGSSGSNTGTINCAFDANTGATNRTGTIRVTAAGATGSPTDVTVIQAGSPTPTPTPTPTATPTPTPTPTITPKPTPTPTPAALSVLPVNRDVSKDVGTTTFSVSNTGTGTMSWSAAVTSGSDWLHITSGSSGTNTGTINCAFDANTAATGRTGTIRVTASDATGSPTDVTVTQAGSPTPTPTPTPTITPKPTPTPTPSARRPVPDTGQTKCYGLSGKEIDCPTAGQALFGQDANYTINPPSYTKLDNNGNALPDSATSWAMIRDNVTGLVWEMKKDHDGTKNYNNPNDADNEYTWFDPNSANTGTPGNGTDTQDFIDALNTASYGGYKDWRLPTVDELVSIVDYAVTFPAVNTKNFPEINSDYYWTSTEPALLWSGSDYKLDGNYARVVQFMIGFEESRGKDISNYAMAVRGEKTPTKNNQQNIADGLENAVGNRYTDNGDSTVTDNVTGLMWQQGQSDGMLSWEESLSYCENLNLANYDDWRLPTARELSSLTDWSRIKPAINIAYFPLTHSDCYWASTTYMHNTSTAWVSFFGSGGNAYGYKSDEVNYVRAVRGRQPASSVLSITPLIQNVSNSSGTTAFTVSNSGTGTMQWSATVTSGSDWLSIQSGASGTSTGTINCAFTANPASSRTGTIRITADGASGSPKDVSVIQSAASVSARQFWGSWSDGVWIWSKASNQWTKMPSTAGAQMIAAGKVLGNPQDDLVGVWPSGLWVRCATSGQWTRLSATRPLWIVTADMNNDGRDDIVASWPNDGLYCRDSATGQWTKLTSAARQLAAGHFGGIRDDLAGVWNDGLWVRYSTDASWQKIDGSIPVWIAAGDMTGDKQVDIIGSYGSGTWYRNSATAAWTKITTAASQLAAGDLDGDGLDDLIGIWSDGVWVRYTASNQWQKITSSKPSWITTGTTAVTAQTSGAQNDPLESEKNVIDLSDSGPGGQNAIVIILDNANPERVD